MKKVVTAVIFLYAGSLAYGASCATASLNTYINGGSFFSCTEGGGSLTVEFNKTILGSYDGLNLLGSNNSSADPSSITVTPGNLGLDFTSMAFTDNSILVASQAEVVHFFLDGGSNPITETTLSLDNLDLSDGPLHAGTAAAVGQELLCIGGTFTSLPTGLITSVLNGSLGTGQFGCNGTTLIGTAEDSIGTLSAITGIVLPNPSGLSDTAIVQLTPFDPTQIDVIKIQALLAVATGSVSDSGFGNTYTLGTGAEAPEPRSIWLFLGGGIAAVIWKKVQRKRRVSRVRTLVIGD